MRERESNMREKSCEQTWLGTTQKRILKWAEKNIKCFNLSREMQIKNNNA